MRQERNFNHLHYIVPTRKHVHSTDPHISEHWVKFRTTSTQFWRLGSERSDPTNMLPTSASNHVTGMASTQLKAKGQRHQDPE